MEHVQFRDAGIYGTRHALFAVATIAAGLLVAFLVGTGEADGSQPQAYPVVAPPWQGAGAADGSDAVRRAAVEDTAREHLNALPLHAVGQLYVECSHEAIARSLGSGEAELCSVVYDVLLTRHFGGDFDALLAWSRLQHGAEQGDAVAPASPEPAAPVPAGGAVAARADPQDR